MGVMELIHQLHQLNRAEKLYVMQFLISDMVQEQTELIRPGLSYPVWSPHNSFKAASTMLQALNAGEPGRGRRDA